MGVHPRAECTDPRHGTRAPGRCDRTPTGEVCTGLLGGAGPRKLGAILGEPYEPRDRAREHGGVGQEGRDRGGPEPLPEPGAARTQGLRGRVQRRRIGRRSRILGASDAPAAELARKPPK